MGSQILIFRSLVCFCWCQILAFLRFALYCCSGLLHLHSFRWCLAARYLFPYSFIHFRLPYGCDACRLPAIGFHEVSLFSDWQLLVFARLLCFFTRRRCISYGVVALWLPDVLAQASLNWGSQSSVSIRLRSLLAAIHRLA